MTVSHVEGAKIARSIANLLSDRVLILIVLVAVLIRWALLMTGSGTDEIMYIGQAQRLLSGDIGHSAYVGAIRYGINFVQALSLAVFGRNEIGAGGIWFIFSVADIILAYEFARTVWGKHAAFWAAICLATLPLHVEAAGDWLPDAYLNFVIDATFVTLYFALRTGSLYAFAAVGALAGLVFWIKEAVVVYAGAIALFFVLYRARPVSWLAAGVGGLVVIAANFAFFAFFYGDPLYVPHVLKEQVESTYVTQDAADTSALTYLFYLLRWPFYAGYVAWLSSIGGGVILYRRFFRSQGNRATAGGVYVIVWAAALFCIFSFMPISLSPLKFIGKQSNYMLIFTTPFCLLAGYAISSMWRSAGVAAGMLIAISGFYISALEQQRWQIYAANGHAAVAFVAEHRDGPVFGSRSIHRQSVLNELLSSGEHRNPRICSLEELGTWASGGSGDATARVIIDRQDHGIGGYYGCVLPEGPLEANASGPQPTERQLAQLPTCWKQVVVLEGHPGRFGRFVIGSARALAGWLPTNIGGRVLASTAKYWDLHDATVYSVTRDCVRATIAG